MSPAQIGYIPAVTIQSRVPESIAADTVRRPFTIVPIEVRSYAL